MPELPVHPAASLPEALAIVGADTLREAPPPPPARPADAVAPDLSDVRGQPLARRALEVAAAGGHNLVFSGPPGSGKTMLARRLPGLLPPLTPDEAVEVVAVYSAAGLPADTVAGRRPFRSPHHTTSDVALVGGGTRPRPGEVSLAHHGVLFLDELPEFRRATLEVLRQPLEEGHVTVSRHRGGVRLPARFQLVGRHEPLPLRAAGLPARLRLHARRRSGRTSAGCPARCSTASTSTPTVPAVDFDEIAGPAGEPTERVRDRVLAARDRQTGRAAATGARWNACLPPAALRQVARPDAAGERLLRRAVDRAGLTARGLDRLLRVARTLADLAGREASRGGTTWPRPSSTDVALSIRRTDTDSKILEKNLDGPARGVLVSRGF